MRKKIIIATFLASGFLLVYLVSGIIIKARQKKQTEMTISTLPFFSLAKMNGGTFFSEEIKKGPVLIVLFHPECEHCQYEIDGILKSSIPISEAQVLLVSSANPDTIRRFMLQYDEMLSANVITLIDTAWLFTEIFGNSVIPTNYIYDSNLKLVKVLPGEVKTETILKYLIDFEQNQPN